MMKFFFFVSVFLLIWITLWDALDLILAHLLPHWLLWVRTVIAAIAAAAIAFGTVKAIRTHARGSNRSLPILRNYRGKLPR